MSMKNVFESAMNSPFDLSTMIKSINTHHILGNLSDDERTDLETLAREKADPSGSVDVMAKLREMDDRIRTLEAAQNNTATDGTEESVAEYTPGKWYRKGDRASYNGTVYVCTAPDGQVCVWSPAEYPAYWEAAA